MALPDVQHYRRYRDVSIHISSMDGACSIQSEIPRLILTTVQRTHVKLRWLVNIDLKKMMVHSYKGLVYHFKAIKLISILELFYLESFVMGA